MEVAYKFIMMLLFLLTAAVGCTYVSGRKDGAPKPSEKDLDFTDRAYQKAERDGILQREIEEIDAMIELQKAETNAENPEGFADLRSNEHE